MLIKNATLLNPGTEPGIYDILVQNGKIARIEPELDVEDELELDVQGMFVTPGLVDAHTHLGLKADSEGPFYADHNEKKSILSPEMRAIDAIDPQSVNFREAREAGITTCASGPGSLDVIGGQYACIKTAGTVIDDMVLDPYFAMKCALGENPKKAYETTRMGIAATLRNFLFQARAYAQDPNRKFDMKLEPMIPVIRGEKPLEAVTINPDRVMGVEARVGSLAPGKDADLVIWKDRPFVFIQDPVAVFINGERI